jgi:hypothetical protein
VIVGDSARQQARKELLMNSTAYSLPLLFADPMELGAGLAGLIVALSQVVSGIGLAIIAWGTYSSVLRLIATETAALRGHLPKADALAGRVVFATYLLPALDFMVAGGLIKAFAVPDWQLAALLASLVFARSMIGISLRWGITPALDLPALPRVAEQIAAPVSHSEDADAAVLEGLATVSS